MKYSIICSAILSGSVLGFEIAMLATFVSPLLCGGIIGGAFGLSFYLFDRLKKKV